MNKLNSKMADQTCNKREGVSLKMSLAWIMDLLDSVTVVLNKKKAEEEDESFWTSKSWMNKAWMEKFMDSIMEDARKKKRVRGARKEDDAVRLKMSRDWVQWFLDLLFDVAGRDVRKDDEDCVILDGDPNKSLRVVSGDSANALDDDLVVVAEKGQIACRDYPHARHLCVTFPFKTNPHEKYCDLCHCYVCDIRAPCVYWGTGKSSTDHCHSTDKEQKWIELRQCSRQGKLMKLPVAVLHETAISYEPPLCQAPNFSQPRNDNGGRVVVLNNFLRCTGTIKCYNGHKGYGFITLDDGGEDLFVHKSSTRKSEGGVCLARGERVEYEIGTDDRGRLKASNICGAREDYLMPLDRDTGTIKWFGFKGYGFITPDDGGEDLFFRESSAMPSVTFLCFAVGKRLEFDIGIDDRGRRKAVNVCNAPPKDTHDLQRDGYYGGTNRYSEGNMEVSRRSLSGHINRENTRHGGYYEEGGISARDRYYKERACYSCGGEGHLCRECPWSPFNT